MGHFQEATYRSSVCHRTSGTDIRLDILGSIGCLRSYVNKRTIQALYICTVTAVVDLDSVRFFAGDFVLVAVVDMVVPIYLSHRIKTG